MAIQKVKTPFIEDGAITNSKLGPSAVTDSKIQDNTISDIKLVLDYLVTDGSKAMSGDLDMGTNKVINVSPATLDTDAPNWKQVLDEIDANVAGLDFQNDVHGIQIDATLDPGLTPTLGDRYIVTDTATLHANFGTITGVENNDIVEYDGSEFIVTYDVSVVGKLALVWNQGDDFAYKWTGTIWEEFTAFEGVTAGNGLYKSGKTIHVGGSFSITVNADDIDVRIGDTTLLIDSEGLKVNTAKISNKQLEVHSYILTATDITNKYFEVTYDVVDKEKSYFNVGGVTQNYHTGERYDVINDGSSNPRRVSWNTKDLDGVLLEGWEINFYYWRVL